MSLVICCEGEKDESEVDAVLKIFDRGFEILSSTRGI
jgi:hypothetical protein